MKCSEQVRIISYLQKIGRKPGAKYHPPFPENVQVEANNDGSVKSLIFLIKYHSFYLLL